MSRLILLLKLTSLGDLIHTLPALSDALSAQPDIRFDWVIDAHFQEIARWHPAVRHIYQTDHRVWRQELFHLSTMRDIFKVVHDVRRMTYDCVIDAQGNFKTALLSLFTKGVRSGFDRHSVREWIAHLAYQRCHSVSKGLHAVERTRLLFSLALGYSTPISQPDFQIRREAFVKPLIDLPKEYLCFIHGASWGTKLWPESHWLDLIKKSVADGWEILLPWGSLEERGRAERFSISDQVRVLPKLNLSEMGYVLARAKACVSVDTGLSHLVAALKIPSVTIYGPTNTELIGTYGSSQRQLVSNLSCVPCQKKICQLSTSGSKCLEKMMPDHVYSTLCSLVIPRTARPEGF